MTITSHTFIRGARVSSEWVKTTVKNVIKNNPFDYKDHVCEEEQIDEALSDMSYKTKQQCVTKFFGKVYSESWDKTLPIYFVTDHHDVLEVSGEKYGGVVGFDMIGGIFDDEFDKDVLNRLHHLKIDCTKLENFCMPDDCRCCS